MSVIEKLAIISDTITKIMNFVVSNETVKPDFDEYLATLSAKNADTSKVQALIIPYIFESFVLPQRSIPKIPVPVPKSKTLELVGISFAKSESKTLSIPKQNPSLF